MNRTGSSAYRRTSGWTGAVLPPLCSVIMVSCYEPASLWSDLRTHTHSAALHDGMWRVSLTQRTVPGCHSYQQSGVAGDPPPRFFCFLHHSWRWSDKRPQRCSQARLDLHERLCRLWRLTAVLMWSCELCGWSTRWWRSDNLHQRLLRRIMATDLSFVYVTLNASVLFNKDTQGQQRISVLLLLLAAIFQIVIHILHFAICSRWAGSDDSLRPISDLQCFLSTSASTSHTSHTISMLAS